MSCSTDTFVAVASSWNASLTLSTRNDDFSEKEKRKRNEVVTHTDRYTLDRVAFAIGDVKLILIRMRELLSLRKEKVTCFREREEEVIIMMMAILSENPRRNSIVVFLLFSFSSQFYLFFFLLRISLSSYL